MDQLLDTKAAAAVLSLSKSTLEKMRVYGDGPKYLKLGRAVRYRETDLQAWVSARSATSTSDILHARSSR